MVYKLARPAQNQSFDWLIPGKAQSEWCIDNNLFGVHFKAGYNTATYKYCIDYASNFGLEYVNFDAGWSAVEDLYDFTDAMDLRWLWQYAREKGVHIFLWTCAETLERQMPAVLDSIRAWGAKGIMVDFMDRDDQGMVDFYERVAREPAKRQLFVDFHGAYKPTGMERAHPHLMTREGVVAFEWNKWSSILTTEYEVTVPFIRMVAGPLLRADLVACILDRAFVGEDEPPRSPKGFEDQKKRAKARLPAVTEAAMPHLAATAVAWAAAGAAIAGAGSLGHIAAEANAHLARLVFPGFLAATPWERLADLPRYLKGIALRLQKFRANPERDQRHGPVVAELQARYEARRDADRAAGRDERRTEEFRWLVEELRISLFAQELKTPFPVSAKRLEKFWDEHLRK